MIAIWARRAIVRDERRAFCICNTFDSRRTLNTGFTRCPRLTWFARWTSRPNLHLSCPVRCALYRLLWLPVSACLNRLRIGRRAIWRGGARGALLARWPRWTSVLSARRSIRAGHSCALRALLHFLRERWINVAVDIPRFVIIKIASVGIMHVIHL